MKENEFIEYKKSISELKEAVETISGMLNKHGKGEILFGIRNDGKAIGMEIGAKTVRDISKTILENIEPKIHPEIKEEMIDGKKCIKVSFLGSEQPYFAYGRAFIRIGEETRRIGPAELEGMFAKKNKELYRWDNKICDKATVSDISLFKLKAFVEKAGLKFETKENTLKKLGLVHDEKPLNAAVLMFGSKPQEFFPNAKMRGAVFLNGGTMLDSKDYEGDLFYLIEEAQKYILQNIHIGERIEGLIRVDVPEINPDAIREAVVNAFCHRNYYLYGSVDIAIYPDRVEIRSPGKLYGGLTIERIVKGNVSERRNELIADLLHRVHMVERWGRGIEKILLAEPNARFVEIGRQFKTVFPRKVVNTPQKTPQKTPQIKLTDLEQTIVDELKSNPTLSRVELAKNLKLSPETVKEYLEKLKTKGAIRRIGPDKGGHWEVLE
ncbi:ATP-dependent DNA helicase [Candidatus Peregrinibacteria bacterium RIFOXYB2_FULL_32_7]|nr:MAG: ATP-dependent DNA helicase [Candidatus Peregrinibacteria bacterium RIFOXYB2_FULL_32_7]